MAAGREVVTKQVAPCDEQLATWQNGDKTGKDFY